jgi:hypothetical protein
LGWIYVAQDIYVARDRRTRIDVAWNNNVDRIFSPRRELQYDKEECVMKSNMRWAVHVAQMKKRYGHVRRET